MKKTFSFLILALTFTLTFDQSFSFNLSYAQDKENENKRSPQDILATVNGAAITRKQFEEYHLQNLKFIGQRKITKEVSLQDLINRELGIQKAKSSGIGKDPQVIARQNDILFHAQISRDLENKFKEIKVSDEEVKKYYQKNKEYRTAHILYRVRMEPTPIEVKKAFEQSNRIMEILKNKPEQFSRYAKKFSQTTTSKIGGDIGFQPPTALAPEYFNAINGKKVGQIIGPVRTQMGYHIIKILEIKPYEKINKNIYKKILYDQKRDSLMEAYFQNLAKNSEIKKFPSQL